MPYSSSCFSASRVDPVPVSVGAGFLALDWLFEGANSKRETVRSAGGSFGNVMAILAFLGWDSFPVARIGTDSNAKHLLDDLRACRVKTDFIRRTNTGSTPVIIVRVTRSDCGTSKSRFEWRHPRSGTRLPSHRPYPRFLAKLVSANLPQANVFYFDRAEPGSLWLATEMRRRGSVVFFEPSSYRDERMFSACMAVSDIVKYSADRIPEPPRSPDCPSPHLEIQTFAEKGLRFRLKESNSKPGRWINSDAFRSDCQIDSTGCGDWCSAGLIYHLGAISRDEFCKSGASSIIDGIRFGQALASINCSYKGARGPMYAFTRDELLLKASTFWCASK